MSTATFERQALRALPLAPLLALAGLTAALLARLWPDVAGKPFHEDEAVAGLISARPLGEMLHTVVLDRGGAPLHFLLAHAALSIDTTPEALRWVSVVFALATVPLCYDLVRRIDGRTAGLVAAALAATSQLLLVYGTFGRMYSLFAFASALSADAFVWALAKPRRKTALIAATAALVPLAVHPFGAFLLGAEAVVALLLWRGRNVRAALPVLLVGALAIPLLLADLRLSERYAPEAGRNLDSGMPAGDAALRALGGAAGGTGLVLAAFVLFACAGAFVLALRRPAIAALALLAVAVPPPALALLSALEIGSDRLSPRHLIFLLPLWIMLVAVGVARAAARLPFAARVAALAAVVGAAAFAPSAVSEPRTIPTGTERAVAAPSAWLASRIAPGDVLYPYSPLFLATLPVAKEARGYSREPVALARAARRTQTVPAVFMSIPLTDPVDIAALRRRGLHFRAFPSWLVLEARGPFTNGTDAIASAARTLQNAEPALREDNARAYLEQILGAACAALTRLGSAC